MYSHFTISCPDNLPQKPGAELFPAISPMMILLTATPLLQ